MLFLFTKFPFVFCKYKHISFFTNSTPIYIYRSKQTDQLKSQIDLLRSNIEREEEKAELLEVKCNMFNLGEFKQGEEDKVLESLNKKIEHVYKLVPTHLLFYDLLVTNIPNLDKYTLLYIFIYIYSYLYYI